MTHVHGSGLEIDEHGAGHVLVAGRLVEVDLCEASGSARRGQVRLRQLSAHVDALELLVGRTLVPASDESVSRHFECVAQHESLTVQWGRCLETRQLGQRGVQ